MRVLILSVTAGQGHNRTAKAIADYLEARGHICRILDTFDYISPAMGEIVDEGYRLTIAVSPKAFGTVFGAMERAEQSNERMMKAYKSVSRRLSAEIEGAYREFVPDVVVSTMSFAAQIATSIYDRGVSSAPRVGIVTDYTLHPFWVGTNLDALVTPSEQLTESFVSKGIERDTIYPLGIPIDPKFLVPITKEEAFAKLGLKNKPSVLIMGGSMGHGDLIKAIEKLDALPLDFQLLAVCGSNKKMYDALVELQTVKDKVVYGFTDQVHVLMSAADMIVTKPGGLTVSESIAKRLPMVLVDPIPGQEDRNMDFLCNHGMAMRTGKMLPVEDVVGQLMFSAKRRELMSLSQEAFGKPNATQGVGELLEKLVRQG